MAQNSLGLIHIYCGDGKGKTSAAVGLSVRASGYGYRVLFVQFLKSGRSSEVKVLEGLDNVTVFDGYCTDKFVISMSETEKAECREKQCRVFEQATQKAVAEKYDILVLDEIFGAIGTDTVKSDVVLDFLKNKPEKLEVIMTGREPSEGFLKIADYVTEMRKIKHPYDMGIKARRGIED